MKGRRASPPLRVSLLPQVYTTEIFSFLYTNNNMASTKPRPRVPQGMSEEEERGEYCLLSPFVRCVPVLGAVSPSWSAAAAGSSTCKSGHAAAASTSNSSGSGTCKSDQVHAEGASVLSGSVVPRLPSPSQHSHDTPSRQSTSNGGREARETERRRRRRYSHMQARPSTCDNPRISITSSTSDLSMFTAHARANRHMLAEGLSEPYIRLPLLTYHSSHSSHISIFPTPSSPPSSSRPLFSKEASLIDHSH